MERLSQNHDEHIGDYGAGLSQRLTGLHETCHIEQFKSGASQTAEPLFVFLYRLLSWVTVILRIAVRGPMRTLIRCLPVLSRRFVCSNLG